MIWKKCTKWLNLNSRFHHTCYFCCQRNRRKLRRTSLCLYFRKFRFYTKKRYTARFDESQWKYLSLCDSFMRRYYSWFVIQDQIRHREWPEFAGRRKKDFVISKLRRDAVQHLLSSLIVILVYNERKWSKSRWITLILHVRRKKMITWKD